MSREEKLLSGDPVIITGSTVYFSSLLWVNSRDLRVSIPVSSTVFRSSDPYILLKKFSDKCSSDHYTLNRKSVNGTSEGIRSGNETDMKVCPYMGYKPHSMQKFCMDLCDCSSNLNHFTPNKALAVENKDAECPVVGQRFKCYVKPAITSANEYFEFLWSLCQEENTQ